MLSGTSRLSQPRFLGTDLLALLELTLSIGLTVSFIAIMGSVEADKGVAADSLEATAYALGITFFGVFMSSVFSRAILLPSTLAEPLKDQAVQSIGDSYLVARMLAEPPATALIEAAKAAFSTTHSTLLMTSAGLTGCLAVVVFIMLGSYRRDG
ncbi:MFS transporter [Aeromonas sp. D3]|uniref:hypothetical protein n=1 Tax=Aeromonas sp. D3 TaxID=2990474 RepID=UPI0022E925A4|nr:hypothetical protein [Aeromonas sp. D3]